VSFQVNPRFEADAAKMRVSPDRWLLFIRLDFHCAIVNAIVRRLPKGSDERAEWIIKREDMLSRWRLMYGALGVESIFNTTYGERLASSDR